MPVTPGVDCGLKPISGEVQINNPPRRWSWRHGCLTCVRLSVPESCCGSGSWRIGSGLQDSASRPASFYQVLPQAEEQRQTGRLQGAERQTTRLQPTNHSAIEIKSADECRSDSVVGPPSLTSPSSSAALSAPLCASRYFEWKSRPSKLCQGIRAALGSGRPLAQLAPSRWLSPRTYRDPSCTARLHRDGSCEQREGKKKKLL